MAYDSVTTGINGALRVGDTVISANMAGYAYLVGKVIDIQKRGSKEHETGNPADDVHVNFYDVGYSKLRLKEIETALNKMYGDDESIEDRALDDVIMPPDSLINTAGFTREELKAILESKESAAALCECVIYERTPKTEAPAPVTQEPFGGSATVGAMTKECLFSPLQFYLHNPKEEQKTGEYWKADIYDDEYRITDEAAFGYLDAIELAILREREKNLDKTHGMAEYLPDELRKKVWSMFPCVECHGDRLYCVTKLELTAPLTPEETALLKDDWSGQLSDGWGEGFTQREIKVSDEELYVSTWTSDKSVFFVDTQAEFDRRIEKASDIQDATRDTALSALPSEPPQAAPAKTNENYTSVLECIRKDKAEKQEKRTYQKVAGEKQAKKDGKQKGKSSSERKNPNKPKRKKKGEEL